MYKGTYFLITIVYREVELDLMNILRTFLNWTERLDRTLLLSPFRQPDVRYEKRSQERNQADLEI
jgi:hypothetical protein